MASEHQSLRVFISYARSDASAFAEELLAGLEAAGFDPFLDRHDIAAGEDWEARLGNLLQQADTVVYVLSPASVASERCKWEIERAESFAKRLIPVVALDVTEADTPQTLRRLNYIFFSPGHPFGPALRDLAAALRTDVAWIREHTRLAELAARWRDDAKPERLLRGSELEAAKAWMSAWKAGEPPVTDLHREFIQQSEAAEQVRTSEERKRLDEMASAQADRARALKIAARNTRIGTVVSGLLFAATVGGGILLLRTSRQLDGARESVERLQSEVDQGREANDLKQTQLKEAQEALALAQQSLAARPAQPAPPPAPGTERPGKDRPDPSQAASYVQEALRQSTIAQGWDTDIFWCAGRGEGRNRETATNIQDLLITEQTRQLQAGGNRTSGGLSFAVGRVRLRSLSEQVNARAGYQVRGNQVRGESGESGQAQALRTFVTAQGGPELAFQMSGMSTPYYLSVFICGASQ